MNTLIVIIVFCSVGLLWAVYGVYRTLINQKNNELISLEQEWLPEELKNAVLVMNEANIECRELSGRVDRVYRSNQILIPLEIKTRKTPVVYKDDILQLSLQAWVLRQNNQQTSDYGFVAIFLDKMEVPVVKKAHLLSDVDCAEALSKYRDIINGRCVPKKSIGKKCVSCQYQRNCK